MDVKNLQDQIIEDFLAHIGDVQNELTDNDRELLKAVAKDAAELTIKVLKGDSDAEAELKIVNATIINLTIAKYFPVKDIFWTAVQRAGTVLLSALVRAAISAAVAAV